MAAQKRIIFLAITLLFAVSPCCRAQVFSSYDLNDELFKCQVKLIDEFIERFNDEPSAWLRKTYEQEKKSFPSRKMLLASLFNLENTSLRDRSSHIDDFFNEVLNEKHPVQISFTDSDWYAEAESYFLYNGQKVSIPLILHIKSHGNDWAKWMIDGLGDLKQSNFREPSISINKKQKVARQEYLPTSAYATNFVELHYIFSGDMMSENFFERPLIESSRGKQFIEAIKSGKLKFSYISTIKFHFFQVKGWIFTVEQFERRTYNSGWLISQVRKVSESEKNNARKKLLNR